MKELENGGIVECGHCKLIPTFSICVPLVPSFPRSLIPLIPSFPHSAVPSLEWVTLASGPAVGAVVHSVPIPLTRLVGRQHELTEGAALLAVSRLLTLTGPGGSGKTRLSIALAAQVDSLFTGGIVWIELASLADPRALAEHIAAAVGVRDYGARPVLEAIVEQLEGDPTLLILDNCEHVVDAAARLTRRLLGGCPDLRGPGHQPGGARHHG
jgi:AAA domain